MLIWRVAQATCSARAERARTIDERRFDERAPAHRSIAHDHCHCSYEYQYTTDTLLKLDTGVEFNRL